MFFSPAQLSVFVVYVTIYTLVILAPQVVIAVTMPSKERALLARVTLGILALVGLHNIALVYTGLSHVFIPTDLRGYVRTRASLQAFVGFSLMALVHTTNYTVSLGATFAYALTFLMPFQSLLMLMAVA